jgi:hypothetical protein
MRPAIQSVRFAVGARWHIHTVKQPWQFRNARRWFL